MGSRRAIYSYIAPRPRIWFVRGRRPRTNQIRGRGGYIAVYSPTRPHIYISFFEGYAPHIIFLKRDDCNLLPLSQPYVCIYVTFHAIIVGGLYACIYHIRLT